MEGETCFSNHLVTAFLFVLALVHFSSARTLVETTNTQFIRTSCNVTIYPRLCYASLANQANAIRSDPKLLAKAALSVSLNATNVTSGIMVRLAQTHGLNPREVGAMQDCMEQLSDSVVLLRNSIGEMGQIGQSNFALKMNDIQTWVSAALTNDDTCSEGFAEKAMTGNTKTTVREQILNVAHLTSNALALIRSYASSHG